MSKDWMKKKSKFECWIFEFQKFSKLSIFDDVDDGLSSFKTRLFSSWNFPLILRNNFYRTQKGMTLEADEAYRHE